jgi:uncharacterized repeat protein (TIGR02543 family)
LNGLDLQLRANWMNGLRRIVFAGAGLALFGIGPAHGQILDSTRFVLDVRVVRPERYSLEVGFPSAPGARAIVDGSVNPALANIDPSTIPNRTIVVYRDGRVVLGGTSAPPIAPSFGSATSASLTPAFHTVQNAGFTPYYAGTVNPAWGDYDRDGDLDLPMFENLGDGTFREMPGFRTIMNGGNYHGSGWCDFDGDGDLDLAMLSYDNVPTVSILLRNDGNGSFVDLAPSLGMNVAGRGETVVWGDFDNDGDPDLFAPYYSHVPPYQSYMYRNDGGGQFTDVSDDWGVSMRGLPESLKPEGAAGVDWDDDGDLDLYCASHLFVNDGTGHFADVRADVGLPAQFDEGATFVDVDNDGDFDLYTRNPDIPRVFRNDGGHYVDVTAGSGIPPAQFYWGDSWSDADNDGDVDLLLYDFGVAAHLMLNRGDGTFVPDPKFEALEAHWGAGAWADYDRDGDLDFIDGGSPYTMFASRLDREPGFPGSFLRVHVVGADSLENQQGATIRLRASSGGPDGVTQTRAVGVGAAYLTCNEYTAHFGLGVAGAVSRAPNLDRYVPDTPVLLTATPAPGYHFAGWVGDLVSFQNPVTISMDVNHVVQARFERDSHPLTTAVPGGGGSITRTPDRSSYLAGSRVDLTAAPEPGWSFVAWSGDATGSLNPTTLLVDGPKSVTASFSINSYPVSLTALGEGSVVKMPNQASYTYGTVVALTAVPAFGYHFAHWGVDASGTTNPHSLTVDGPKVVTALFEINTYPLVVTVSGGGSVARSPEQPLYEHGARVKLTATAGEGYRFVGWSGDATGSTNPITITMDRARAVTALFQPIQRRYWLGTSGGGDGVTWSMAANWSGNTPPGAAEEVVLDQSTVPGDYTVTLPGGTLGTTIARLTILPAPGRSITLVLPSANRGKPGLQVGDAALGIADIRLGAGATLRNESGANVGNGIVLASPSADSIAIENGARYVHGTALSPGAVIALLSTAAGTERGEFVYHVPGHTAFAVDASGVTYGTLVLERDDANSVYTIGGAAPLTIRGDLEIGAGISLSSSMTSDLILGGGLSNSGTLVFLPAAQRVLFSENGTHRLSGAGTIQIDGPSSVPASATLAIAGDTFGNNGVMQIDGTLRIEGSLPPGGSGSYRYGSAGTLAFASAGSSFAVNDNAYWPTVFSPPDVDVQSASGITMNVTRVVAGELRTAGPITRSDRLTIEGTARLLAGGSFVQSPLYGDGATLAYARGGAVGVEWIASSVVGVGVPRHVVVDAASDTLRPGSGHVVPGDLRVTSGQVELPSSGIVVMGNVQVDGALRAEGVTLWMMGGADQVVSGTGSLDLATLAIQKSAGFVRLAREVTCVGDATHAALEFDGTSDRLELNGRRLSILGRVGGSNADGAIAGGAGSALEIHGAGDAGAIRFAAGAEQLEDLAVDLTAAGRVAMPVAPSITGTLTLARGRIDAGGTLVVLPGGVVARDSGYVTGTMRKTLSPGTPTATFEVGTTAGYAPVALTLESLENPIAIEAASLAGDHPQAASAPFLAKSVHHHWSLSASSAIPDAYRATFHYLATERDSAADTSRFAVRRYEAGAWSFLATGARGTTSVEALGSGALGDYAIGEVARWTLHESVVGDGSIARAPAGAEYDDGATVSLTARPEPGYAFVGWSGDVVGSDTTVAIVMNANHGVIATFADAPPTAWMRYPNGGEIAGVGTLLPIAWEAVDPLGVRSVHLLLSRNGAAGPFDTVATNVQNDGAWTWTVSGPVTPQAVLRVVVRDSTGLMAADESDAPFTISGTLASPAESLPRELALAPIAPNPVVGRARIAYAVPRESEVRLSVVDVQGREIAVLAHGTLAPGRYEVAWAGRIGNRLAPAGIYFVRLRAGGIERVRRMVVAR